LRGVPFDPLAFEPVERDFEDWDEGGLGIGFVRQICDDVAYAHVGGRNVLTLSLTG
jgi:anti-sigma regulatory factor (Ser/Thr protein kinase)